MVEVAEHLKGRDFTRIGSWSSDELKTVLDLADELKELQASARAARAPPRPHARDDLPEALDADARLVRGRHRPARRPRPLPRGERPPARPRRDDQGHGDRPRPLPRRDHDPHLRAGRRRGARRARRHPRDQRAHRLLAPVPGARRPDDDPRAARPALGRPPRLPRRRQQRVRLADGRRRPASECASSPRRRKATSPTPTRSPPRAAPPCRWAAPSSSSATRRRPPASADVLYTDVWTSMGQEDEAKRRRADLAGYRIDDDAPHARRARRASSSTACRPTTARRSPRRCSTARSRRSGTRPRTGCTPRRRCWRSIVRWCSRSRTTSRRGRSRSSPSS